MITVKPRGSFRKVQKFLKTASQYDYEAAMHQIGEKGVEALREATPKKTGKTSESWAYELEETKSGYKIIYSNANVVNGEVIALLIQLGHGTKYGKWVEGRDYINPALQRVFDELIETTWGEVTKE